MKWVAVILLLFTSINLKANNPYRAYLLSKVSYRQHFSVVESEKTASAETSCIIPRFERPKGAVFCRMEDFLTSKTKIWIKVGVK